MNAAVAAAGDNGDVNVADSAGEQKGTFTVEYNDGTGKTVRIYTTTHNPELPTMTRDGYKFKGWTVNGGTTVYTDFSTYEFTNDGATLTAVWSANSYYYYAPTTTDTKTDTTKGSPKTFDAGVGIYAGVGRQKAALSQQKRKPVRAFFFAPPADRKAAAIRRSLS